MTIHNRSHIEDAFYCDMLLPPVNRTEYEFSSDFSTTLRTKFVAGKTRFKPNNSCSTNRSEEGFLYHFFVCRLIVLFSM